MKIFGWAYDESGCGNYRVGMPLWALGRLGHEVSAFTVLQDTPPEDLDIFVGQRVSDGDGAAYWIDLAGQRNRPFRMIYELDDDLWSVDPNNPELTTYAGSEIRETVARCLTVSDAVTVSTRELADVVSRYHANVFVLPNCIDQSILDMRRVRPAKLTLGWAGSASHLPDFKFVQAELSSFLRRNSEVDTHFVGSNYGSLVGRPATRFTPWNENLHSYLSKVDFDIGVAPLAPTRFNRSKSDIKVVEYAALGIPVVASDFGPYAESVQHGETGFLVRHPYEWTKYLRMLVSDEAMRLEFGENARKWARTRTIQGNVWRWEDSYRKVRDRCLAVKSVQ